MNYTGLTCNYLPKPIQSIHLFWSDNETDVILDLKSLSHSFSLPFSVNCSLSEKEFEGKSGVLLQRISRLKQDRAAVCIPQRGEAGEGKISPDTGTLAGVRGRTALSKNTKEEKAALLYELVTVRVSIMKSLPLFYIFRTSFNPCMSV